MKATALVVGLVVGFVTLGGKAPGEDAGTPPEPALTLSVSLYKTQLVVGEPILLSLKLSNEAEHPIRCKAANNRLFADSPFTFMITDQNGSAHMRLAQRGRGAVILRGPLVPLMAPGEFQQCEKMFLPRVNMGRLRKVLPLLPVGRYQLKARVLLESTGESNAVDFEVKEALGANAAPSRLMNSTEVAGFIAGYRSTKPKDIEELLSKHPDSAYALYARARLLWERPKSILGTRHSYTLSDDEKNELRELIVDGMAFVNDHPRMPLSDNILLNCARMHRILRDKENYLNTVEKLLKDFPDGDARQTAVGDLEKMRLKVTPEGDIIQEPEPDEP